MQHQAIYIQTQTVEMATHANWAKHLQTSVIQKDARMVNKLKEDWNGLQLWLLKTCSPGFQSSFLWFVTFEIMLGKHILFEKSCDFVILQPWY